jgi:hypothetical protein
VSVLCRYPGGVEDGEQGLEFFVKQGFGFVAGGDGIYWTFLSRVHNIITNPRAKNCFLATI